MHLQMASLTFISKLKQQVKKQLRFFHAKVDLATSSHFGFILRLIKVQVRFQ